AREAYLNRPTCFAIPAATEESRLHEPEATPPSPRRRPSQEGRKTFGKPQPNADSDEAH
ncbi:hypothetical protein E4U60_000149, partial [Claviceps pazoutovae]